MATRVRSSTRISNAGAAGAALKETISPYEMETPDFRTSLLGYRRSDVQRRLNETSEVIQSLRNQLRKALDELETLRSREDLVKEAILSAQQAAAEMQREAREQARDIVDQARRQAKETEDAGLQRLHDLRWEIEKINQERKKFVERYRQQMADSLRTIDQPMSQQTEDPAQV